MEKIAFRMKLKPGQLEEYRRRHDDLWLELRQALKEAGVSDYSIHHDPETDALFATLWRSDQHGMETLPDLPVMKRWWAAMAPFMDTNEDSSPVSVPLETVFHLP